jgi:DNA-directed RNA polymerase subunit RPC12/RpoP
MTTDESLPVLCASCGGPVAPGADWSLHCSYCGTEDRLPDDELRRVLELKRRITAAARSAAQLRGLNAVAATMFERGGALSVVVGAGLGVTLLAAVAVIAGAISSGGDAATMAGRGFLLWAYVSVPVGMVFAVSLSLLIGRHTYRARVRGELLARAPREEGAPMRCRVCGADLPDDDSPFVRCRYCSSQSLATEEVHDRRLERLDREQQAYRSRAGKTVAHVAHVGLQMDRTLLICVVLTYVITYASIGLSQLLL